MTWCGGNHAKVLPGPFGPFAAALHLFFGLSDYCSCFRLLFLDLRLPVDSRLQSCPGLGFVATNVRQLGFILCQLVRVIVVLVHVLIVSHAVAAAAVADSIINRYVAQVDRCPRGHVQY